MNKIYTTRIPLTCPNDGRQGVFVSIHKLNQVVVVDGKGYHFQNAAFLLETERFTYRLFHN